jgi:beta-lactam-binding protein with PASTA domain
VVNRGRKSQYEARAAKAKPQFSFTRPRADPVQVNHVDAPRDADDAASSASARSHDGRQGLFVVVENGSGEVAAGEEWTTQVRITNTGTIVERADLRADGLPADWVTFDPAQVNLDQNQEQVVNLRIRPPRSWSVAAGRHPYVVHVWSLTNPAVNVAASGAITVGPYADCSMAIDPPASTGPKQSTHTVTITNNGNRLVSAVLGAADPEGRIRAYPAQLGVTLAPGRPLPVELQVIAKRRIWVGSPEPQRVQVTLAGTDGPIATADITMTQTSTLPGWTPRLVAAAAIVLILALGLAYRQWDRVRPRPVPELTNKPTDEAVAALEKAGFEADIVRASSTATPVNVVFAQDPRAAVALPGLSKVKITVSSGAPLVPVADVTGQTLDRAKEVLHDFTVANPPPEFNDDVQADLIISQEPLANTKAPSGSTITVRMSKGPKPITMPTATGNPGIQVRQQLEAQGLKVNLVTQKGPVGTAPGTVYRQDPKPGSAVTKGQTITIYVEPEAPPTTTTTAVATKPV